jgi:hypothetical protein
MVAEETSLSVTLCVMLEIAVARTVIYVVAVNQSEEEDESAQDDIDALLYSSEEEADSPDSGMVEEEADSPDSGMVEEEADSPDSGMVWLHLVNFNRIFVFMYVCINAYILVCVYV